MDVQAEESVASIEAAFDVGMGVHQYCDVVSYEFVEQVGSSGHGFSHALGCLACPSFGPSAVMEIPMAEAAPRGHRRGWHARRHALTNCSTHWRNSVGMVVSDDRLRRLALPAPW